MSGWEEAKIEAIALVASAGGVGALSAVLRGLPADLAAAVVVQQHLSVNGSSLTSVLAKRTGLDVAWADDGCRPMPGQVAVCPPRTRMEILPDGSCSLLPNESGAREYPHDGLLTSLADSYGPRAMAVVLTGMGRDGAAGAAAVKAAGGFVIAQSEDTAEHPQMPLAAAAVGAHLRLPLPEIGSVIADVVSGRPLPRSRSEIEAAETLFAGPGEIRQLLRGMDWTRTPLGPVTEWSGALRLMVRTMLDSVCPMAVWWGPQLIQIYNQKWRDFLGAKHPRALVGRARQTWPEQWPVIGPMVEHVLTHAEVVVDEDFQIFIDRLGYQEEVFITFSLAPILDGSGTVIGVHNMCWDTTKNVVGERRMRALRAVAAGMAGASGLEEAAEAAAAALASDPADVPFALCYLIDHASQQGRLTAAAGLAPGSAAAPLIIDFSSSGGGGIWPLASLLSERQRGSAPPNGGGVLIEGLDERLRGLLPLTSVAEGAISPRSAFLLPLRITAEEPPAGVLVAGVSPHRPFDDLYRGFLDLIAGQIGAGLAQAQAQHRERQRLERLAELDRAKTEFFSNVSHEFRTPLTLMLGPLEEMLRDQTALPPGLADDLELIRRNGRRLLRLVGALLDFSQIEAGRLRAHFIPVDLAERTRAIVAQFESAAERAGLELGVTLDPLPEPAWIDPEMWEKIVANLLSNALKFTFTGRIDVTLRALPAHAELVVRDTGVGIPAGELPYVFKRFHRVRDTRARTQEGAGIGLALADELVRRHHGRIRAASVVGRGSTFTVWIPLGRRPAVPEGPPPDRGTPAFAAAMAEEASRWDADIAVAADNPSAFETVGERPPGRGAARCAAGARVLVVDDNQDMRGYLARLLGTQWRVSAARDGDEALLLARRDPPDIIVSDVTMPGLDGFALLRAIRRDEDLAATPVVLLTARAGEEAGEESAIEGLLAGADDYVVKPFSAREMLARVAAQLELSRAEAALRASQRRLRYALETEAVGILYFDHAGTVVDANDMFLRMTGYTRAEVERGELSRQRMTAPEHVPASREQLDHLAATEGIGPYEKEYFAKDGTRRWMLIVGRDIGGGAVCEFCIDITDLKRAEEASRPLAAMGLAKAAWTGPAAASSIGGMARQATRYPPAPIDPAALEETLRPFGESRMLPRSAYVDQAVFDWERRHFYGGWVCAARGGQLANPGDQRAEASGDGGVLLVRGDDGEVRAFANACRHRGHELLPCGGAINRKAIVCPYHSWGYSLAGALRAAPGFRNQPGFDAGQWSLVRLPATEWHGLVFVDGSGGAAGPLPLERLGELVAPYEPERLVIAGQRTYDVAANWKVLAENYQECYHCPAIHPELCHVSPPDSGRNFLVTGPWIGGVMDLRDGMATMSLDGTSGGIPLRGLGEEGLRTVIYVNIFPNVLLSLHPDYVMTHRLVPLRPDRTRIECCWAFAPEAVARPGFDPGYAVEFWDIINRQDWAACESVQRGLSSPHAVPGPLSPAEDAVYSLVTAIARGYLGQPVWNPDPAEVAAGDRSAGRRAVSR